MRVLKPEIAQERKRKILHWAVHQYVRTSKPVSSESVAEKGSFKVSSATIRNVLNELEKEGYLYQPHASGGRIPTDMGYRSYVNYVLEMQKHAVFERETIEQEYTKRMDETDQLMAQTSKILSALSKSAGFVLPPAAEGDSIRRVDIIPLDAKRALMVLVTNAGVVKHWPINLEGETDHKRLRILSNFMNYRISGLTFSEAKKTLWEDIHSRDPEIKDTGYIARQLLEDFDRYTQPGENLYLEGMGRLSDSVDDHDFSDLRNVLKVVEEKKQLSEILRERLKNCIESGRSAPGKKGSYPLVRITIGSENEVRELRNFTLISSAYCVKDKMLGLVGILGPKRMEYPKMISIVNDISEMVSHALEEWNKDS